MSLIQRLYEIGVVPVVAVDSTRQALELAGILKENGLSGMEITLRTEAAAAAIAAVKRHLPEMLVGAGTIHSPLDAGRAVDAGADFIVMPGFREDTVRFCMEKGVLILPGCDSTLALEQATALGLSAVKLFPAEASGGALKIKALHGPYPTVRFMPTGGVTAENMQDYLALENVFAVGGTWLAPKELLREGRFDEIGLLVREAVRRVHGMHLKHLGINCTDPPAAWTAAKEFARLCAVGTTEFEKSILAGSEFELVKTPFWGKHGHICIGVRNLERTYHYLKRQGYRFREETAARREDGSMQAIYLVDEIGGFAIHFLND